MSFSAWKCPAMIREPFPNVSTPRYPENSCLSLEKSRCLRSSKCSMLSLPTFRSSRHLEGPPLRLHIASWQPSRVPPHVNHLPADCLPINFLEAQPHLLPHRPFVVANALGRIRGQSRRQPPQPARQVVLLVNPPE